MDDARAACSADPAWTAAVSFPSRWLPVSPVTGRLDAFEWKDPLAGDDHAGALIEAQRRHARAPRSRPRGRLRGRAKHQGAARSDPGTLGRPARQGRQTERPSGGTPQQGDRAYPDSRASIPQPSAHSNTACRDSAGACPDDPGPDPEAQSGPGSRFKRRTPRTTGPASDNCSGRSPYLFHRAGLTAARS